MRAAEQTRARYPDADGFVERDGVQGALGTVRLQRAARLSAPPDMGGPALAGRGSARSRTWLGVRHRDHVRPARERALGPAAEPGALRSARVRRGRRCRARRGWGGPCARRGVVRPRRVADPGGGAPRACGRPRRDRPGHPTRRHATGIGRVHLRRFRSRPTRAGPRRTATTGCAIGAGTRSSSSASASASRIRRSRSRTPSTGRSRPTPRPCC